MSKRRRFIIFKKTWIIVQCVFQFIFPNVQMCHLSSTVFYSFFWELLCYISCRRHYCVWTIDCKKHTHTCSPLPLCSHSFSCLYLRKQSHPASSTPPITAHMCALPVSVREKHAVPVRVRWVNDWITGIRCSAITVTLLSLWEVKKSCVRAWTDGYFWTLL